jgi:hypothetical protein
MLYPGFNSGNVIFSVGNWYPFRIHNLVQLQDQDFYYVLLDINGSKHFLASLPYKHYGFKIGDEINCKIDRINCTGRILLEPKHPYYLEGEIYDFDVLNYVKNRSEHSLIVKEIMGNSLNVSLCEKGNIRLISENKVKCIVKYIRKGTLFLELFTGSS